RMVWAVMRTCGCIWVDVWLVGLEPLQAPEDRRMTTFEIPTVTSERLRLRAFRSSDLGAYAAMQANPEVMRYMVMGRPSTPAEVWRTMLMSLGSWALRGYGMWACEKLDGDVFVGSVGVFCPLDWPESESAYSLGQSFWGQGFALKRRGGHVTGCSGTCQ